MHQLMPHACYFLPGNLRVRVLELHRNISYCLTDNLNPSDDGILFLLISVCQECMRINILCIRPYTNISATSRKVAMQGDRVTTMTNRVSQDSVAISEIKSIYGLVTNPRPHRLHPMWH